MLPPSIVEYIATLVDRHRPVSIVYNSINNCLQRLINKNAITLIASLNSKAKNYHHIFLLIQDIYCSKFKVLQHTFQSLLLIPRWRKRIWSFRQRDNAVSRKCKKVLWRPRDPRNRIFFWMNLIFKWYQLWWAKITKESTDIIRTYIHEWISVLLRECVWNEYVYMPIIAMHCVAKKLHKRAYTNTRSIFDFIYIAFGLKIASIRQ